MITNPNWNGKWRLIVEERLFIMFHRGSEASFTGVPNSSFYVENLMNYGMSGLFHPTNIARHSYLYLTLKKHITLKKHPSKEARKAAGYKKSLPLLRQIEHASLLSHCPAYKGWFRASGFRFGGVGGSSRSVEGWGPNLRLSKLLKAHIRALTRWPIYGSSVLGSPRHSTTTSFGHLKWSSFFGIFSFQNVSLYMIGGMLSFALRLVGRGPRRSC